MKLYVRLLVNNFDECFRFYRDVIGLTPAFGAEGEAYASFAIGDAGIDLFMRNLQAQVVGTADLQGETEPAQDRFLLNLGVDNVDDTAHRLKERGVEVFGGPEDHPDWGIRSAYLRDPDGNLIEIYHSLAGQGTE